VVRYCLCGYPAKAKPYIQLAFVSGDYAVYAIDCDQITLDHIHDPVLAHA